MLKLGFTWNLRLSQTSLAQSAAPSSHKQGAISQLKETNFVFSTSPSATTLPLWTTPPLLKEVSVHLVCSFPVPFHPELQEGSHPHTMPQPPSLSHGAATGPAAGGRNLSGPGASFLALPIQAFCSPLGWHFSPPETKPPSSPAGTAAVAAHWSSLFLCRPSSSQEPE